MKPFCFNFVLIICTNIIILKTTKNELYYSSVVNNQMDIIAIQAIITAKQFVEIVFVFFNLFPIVLHE